MGFVDIFFDFFFWWYGDGIKRFFAFFAALFAYINNMFSIKAVLGTLFEPWKRVVSERRKGWEGFRDWLVDNLVSRFVGFVMRALLIFVFMIVFVTFGLFFAASFTFWFLYPLILVGMFFYIFFNK